MPQYVPHLKQEVDTLSHLKRIITEKSKLDTKRERLNQFLGTPRFDSLPEEEQLRLSNQASVMKQYSAILGERIEFANNPTEASVSTQDRVQERIISLLEEADCVVIEEGDDTSLEVVNNGNTYTATLEEGGMTLVACAHTQSLEEYDMIAETLAGQLVSLHRTQHPSED